MKIFKGQVAVVTGAASGIGRAMVAGFLGVDMNVVLADIDEERLENMMTSQNPELRQPPRELSDILQELTDQTDKK